MKTAHLFWHGHRYFPYERDLARREVEAIFAEKAEELEDGFAVPVRDGRSKEVERLTYFKGAEIDSRTFVPDQAKLEASAFTNGQAWLPELQTYPALRRQSTRYSAHGLHEYKGKFNPQVVRAIGNLIGLEVGDWVLDPFCGSGTTLLEAAHNGWNALGFDVNPLGAMIANAKVTAFNAPPERLKEATTRLLRRLEHQTAQDISWEDSLPNAAYLAQWFTFPVLQELACILSAIDENASPEYASVFRVVLSDICREVSLQDPGDLRIRRRKEPCPDFHAIADFSAALQARIATIVRAREHITPKHSRQVALHADCRFPDERAARFLQEGRRILLDAAITSPPYATALPYVDTQRLSLCLLGLIEASEIRSAERALIGNREIGDGERLLLEKDLVSNAAALPEGVARFCCDLLKAADHSAHGFRRRNVPALVYKYFAQMAETFAGVQKLIRRGGHYALVVGGNKTTLQDKEIIIDTPMLLGEVAVSCGWTLTEVIPLDTYQRYDVHQKNSIRTEMLLLLRNDQTI